MRYIKEAPLENLHLGYKKNERVLAGSVEEVAVPARPAPPREDKRLAKVLKSVEELNRRCQELEDKAYAAAQRIQILEDGKQHPIRR